MSPLPITRSALDRLGERLVANDTISDEDYDLLLQVLTAYQAALEETHERLVSLGYEPTTRVKTTAVIVEKLRREDGMKLKGVQDIAGARLVVDGGRRGQDDVVRRIVDAFGDGSREPKVKDRRAEPSAGYRAVHVVVTVQDVPVEIQVRTPWQDQWAQIVEALGDKWGRGIRYGAGPTAPDTLLAPETDITRQYLWTVVVGLGDVIATGEEIELALTLLDHISDHDLSETSILGVIPVDTLPRVAAAISELVGHPLPASYEAIVAFVAERDRLREAYVEGIEVQRRSMSSLRVLVDAVQ